MWQDIALTAGSVLLSAGLIPSIASEHKPSPWTSIVTSLVLAVFAVVYFTLDLNLAGAVAGISSALWCVLFAQKMMGWKRHRHTWRYYEARHGNWVRDGKKSGWATAAKKRCTGCNQTVLVNMSGLWSLAELNGEFPDAG